MKASNELIKKLMELEGLRLEAYRDAAGVPTIGYGHTRDVRMGDRITAYYARELLLEDVAGMTRQVEALGICRTQAQLDALVSLAFNIGPKRLRRSTLVKLIRRGADAAAIRREWMRWVYAGGKRLEGLVRRREWEAARFFASEKDAR